MSLVDLDQTGVSKKLAAALEGEKGLQVLPEALATARERVRKGKATVAIVLPQGFSEGAARAFFSGAGKPVVQFLYDPSHTAELGMVKGMLTQYAMQVVSQEAFTGATGRGAVKETLHQLETDSTLAVGDRSSLRDLLKSVDRFNDHVATSEHSGGNPMGGLSMPYTMMEEAVTSGSQIEYNGYAHSFAGMGVQFILFMGIEAGISILLLRQGGLWKRLRSAPISKATLLGARAASAAVIAMIILAVIFLFARIFFKVHVQGSLLGLIAVSMAFSLMTASYGLLVAALGRTAEAARGLAILATLLMVMLGGAWIPAFIFPAWLQKATLLVPTRWAVDGMDAMTWRGFGFAEAVAPTLVLLGFTALFGGLAIWKFRWEED